MINIDIKRVTKFEVIKSESKDDGSFSIETVAECDTEEKAMAVMAAFMNGSGTDVPE